MTVLEPLDDPAYEPVYRPSRGFIPPEIGKGGARSQLRWFRRFSREIGELKPTVWDAFYCSSLDHRGLCCDSCLGEMDEGYYYTDDCCCKAERTRHEEA